MSSDCPPQLQLSIQPTTTSFKRSFEEFGFDLESPVGTRSANAGESGAAHGTGHERHKRARSRTSLDSEANGSTTSSVASEPSDGGNVGTSEPTTTVEPPRLPTPVLPDVDMPSYPEEDEEESFPPRAGVALPPQTVETNPTNTFQLTLDRFNAFDREIEVLRQPEPNLSTASSSSSSSTSALVAPAPPVLPPLIIDPHRLSPETIDFLPEQSPRNVPEVFPLSISVSGVNISSSSARPDRSRESTSPPVRFRQNLDVALERLRSPSPLAPGFVFQDSPTPGNDDEDIHHHSPSLRIERGPPTLPPIPPITNDLHDSNSEASDRNEGPSRPHVVPLNPPTLPPIPSVSEGFPDTSNVWDDDNTTPQPNTARASARREEDLPFRPLSPEIPAGYIDFERDFGQWFNPAEDNMSTSSVSTSAATAGTEREPFGHAAPTSASNAMPTSPQSPSSPLSLHILRARQAVEERGMRLSRIAAADTIPRRIPRSSAAPSSSSRAGPSNATPARPTIQDEYGTLANPTRFGNPTRASLLDNVRPSFNFRYNNWEERRSSLELTTPEEGWAQVRDRLASEIEDTEYRLRRRPRFLGDSAENPEPQTIVSSRPRSEPDTNANFDVDFSSLLRGERHAGTQAMELSSTSERRSPDSVHTQSWVERLRSRRESRMVVSDDEGDDVGSSEYLNRLFTRVNEESDTSRRRSLSSTTRPNPAHRFVWPPTEDTNSGGGTTLAGLDNDPDRALWRPGGHTRYVANRRSRDHFQNARGRTAAALPRPGASNSLVAESASEARRQADFESIRRRTRSPRPWDNPGDQEETQNGMDVDEVQGFLPSALNPQTRRFSALPRRHSPPLLRGNTDDPPTHLAHLEFEDFTLYPPSQTSHSNRFDPPTPISPLHGRVPNEHLIPNFRTNTSASNNHGSASPTTAARLRPAHAMVPPWELPDVSLPFGDLFETLGEGRNRLSHPQRGDTERSESAPSLPHPDLGGTFTGQRYASPDRPPAAPTDADLGATPHSASVAPNRPDPHDTATTMAEARHRSLLERHRQYVMENQYDLMRLEEPYSRNVSEELRNLRSRVSGASLQGNIHQNGATAAPSTGGGPSRPSASPSAPTRQAPGTSRAARHEPPRPGTYSGFLPGPFRNTLLHVERHGSRNGGATVPPIAPETPVARDQRPSTDSPFTSRPLPTESFNHPARDTSSNMFSWTRRYGALETQRRGTGTWAEPEFRRLIEERDREIESIRRRQQEIVESRARQLRERARYRDSTARIQESYEMARTMTVGERDADSNNPIGGETGHRAQSRRRFESLRLNAMAPGTGMRRTRFFSDYMRDEDLDLLSYESLLNLTELAGDVRSRATPADILEKMEKSTYKEWKTADSEIRCPICLDDYELDDPVQKLPNCSHWLHQECLGQWLKSANTCPVCRGSVSETRPLGSRRSARTRSIFSGSLRRHAHGQTGPPPPGDNPGVSRFNHSVATENNLRTSRRGARVAQPEQQVPSASSASAAAVESGSSAPGTSVSANNSRSAGPVLSDSEDEHVEMEFEPHLYRWWR